MLKGKMTIELTDVNTGETDVIEEENMVTNALANIFAPLGHLMNSANVVKIKRSGMSTIDCWPMFAINGRIYYQAYSNTSSYNHVYIINEETNECLKSENYCLQYAGSNTPCYTPVLNHQMLLYCSYGNWSTGPFFMPCNYLATINNLSEPVTKTADKTMKITYTIQEQ